MNELSAYAGFGLLVVRPGMIVMATPFLGALNAPVQVRVGLSVILALLVATGVNVSVTLPITSLTVIVLREIAIGLAIGFSIRVLLSAAEFAGHFIGYQIGLSLGSLIDPQSGVRNNVLAIIYGNLAAVLCLGLNVHHTLLRALADSYAMLPMGFGGIDASGDATIIRMFTFIFVVGIRIAMPVVVVLLLVELALGLMGRVAPSLNVIVAGAPIRIVAGLLVLAASLTALPTILSRFIPVAFNLSADLAQAFR
jgi:flagellar biosynthesis protein FliR